MPKSAIVGRDRSPFCSIAASFDESIRRDAIIGVKTVHALWEAEVVGSHPSGGVIWKDGTAVVATWRGVLTAALRRYCKSNVLGVRRFGPDSALSNHSDLDRYLLA